VRDILVSALLGNNLFVSMDNEELDKILGVMVQCNFQRGDEVIKQGQRGKYFYVIESGDCQVQIKKADGDILTKIMKPGTTFGDLFVLNVPASATVTCDTDTASLWRLSRNLFRKVLRQAEEEKLKRKMAILETMQVFNSLTRHELVTLADSLEPRTYQDGEVIFQQGAVGDCCFILMEGTVVLTQSSELPVAKVDELAKSTLINIEEGADDDADDGKKDLDKAAARNQYVKSMETADKQDAGLLSPSSNRVKSNSGKRVTKAGRRWRSSFKDGQVLKTLEAPDFFGERALLTKEGRIANAIADGEAKCLCISEYKFRQLLGPLQEIAERTKNEYSALVLRRLPMFRNTVGNSDKKGENFVSTLTPGDFIVGDTVMGAGERFNRFFIIWRGEVASLTPKQMNMSDEELQLNQPQVFSRGDYFGYEESMMNAEILQKAYEGKSEEQIVSSERACFGWGVWSGEGGASLSNRRFQPAKDVQHDFFAAVQKAPACSLLRVLSPHLSPTVSGMMGGK
jgi:CRP-like cAMP-binding protein